jgi:hypothetical protein
VEKIKETNDESYFTENRELIAERLYMRDMQAAFTLFKKRRYAPGE